MAKTTILNSGRDRKNDAKKFWLAEIAQAEAALDNMNLEVALAHAREAARLAEELNELSCLGRTARALEALGNYSLSGKLRSRGEHIRNPNGPPEWDGNLLARGTLLIVSRNEHIGRQIRVARLIAPAAARSQRCIVLVERRLVPLFARSFSGTDVRVANEDDSAAYSEAEAVAGYSTLANLFAADDTALESAFQPLQPDDDAVATLDRRYVSSPRPLIGISWASTNETKETPPLQAWSAFMRSLPGSFLSLQYGDVLADVTRLRRESGRDVFLDQQVDSLVDLDLYAAQIAACDVVVTISNTCAHMSGALGKRTFLILDDKLRLTWPVGRSKTPWYPHMTILRQRGRSWPDVFAEVGRLIRS